MDETYTKVLNAQRAHEINKIIYAQARWEI